MIGLQGTKLLNVTPPAAIVDDASYTTTAVDTLGWDWCTFVVSIGATDIAFAALKVQESEDSGMSGAADVTGAIFGTSTNDAGSTSAVPSATDDNKLFVIEVDLKDRMRYLDVVATGGNGTAGAYASVLAVLSRGVVNTASASEAGIDERLIVG